MLLLELYDPHIPGYQNLDADNSQIKWGESRKSKLTLKQLRKLRKLLDVRNVEHVKNLKKIHDQYGAQPQQPAM